MPYTPNNPLIPGDPYSYDLKWIVQQIKAWKDPEQSAAEAKASAEIASEKAQEATDAAAVLTNALFYVTPQMFGAIGDGITDDTDAIKAAILSGQPIFIPAGTYRLTDKISISDNTAIIGFNHPTLKWDNYNGWMFGGQNIKNLIVNGIDFDFGTQTNLNHSISLLQCENISFIDCIFTGGYGYATRLNESIRIHFVRCFFHDITGGSGNPGGGIYGLDMQQLFISECVFSDLDDHGIYMAGTTLLKDAYINNCNFINNGLGAYTNGAAITCYAACQDVHITGCNIDNCRTGIYLGVYGLYADVPKDVSIQGIVINGSTLDGILMQGSSTYIIEKICISDTTIKSMGQDGITARYVDKSIFSNIDVSNVIRNAFDLNGSNYNIVKDLRANTTGSSSNALIIGRNAASSNNIIDTAIIDGSGNLAVYMRAGSNNRFINIVEDTSNFSGPSSYAGTANSYISAMMDTRSILFNSTSPSAGYHNVGEICFNSSASSGSPKGWICTVAGTPGTWTSIGNL